MLKKKITKILLKLGLALFLSVGLFKVGNMLGNIDNKVAYAKTIPQYSVVEQQKSKDISVIKTQRQSNDYEVLIYHSHTHEVYKDTNVVLMGDDLKVKLEAKGLKVKVINDDFTKNDYNNSYYESRKMLKTELQKNNYKLVLDLHTDSLAEGRKITGTDKNGNSVGKIMFVTTTENPNYNENRKCIDELKGYIDKFGSDLTRETWIYKHGIGFYGSDLGNKNGDGNVILIENAFNTNEKIEILRANTYLSSAIKNYIDNHNIK